MRNPTAALIAIATVLVPALAAIAQPGVNLLPNPGFEIEEKGWAKHWHTHRQGDVVKVSLDATVARSGKRSVLFVVPEKGPDKWQTGIAIQQTKPIFRGGKTYTFSAWFKTENVQQAFLNVYEYPAPFPKGTTHKSKRVSGTRDWTRVSITFKARPDILNAQLRCGMRAKPGKRCRVWVDDCKLEEGGKPTAFSPEWQSDFYLIGPKPAGFPIPFNFEVGAEEATPYAAPGRSARGPGIPVLFALYWGGLRDAVELTQRANIRPLTAAINSRGERDRQKEIHESCALHFRSQLNKDPGVLVLTPDTWAMLLPVDKQDIERRVRNGMGLVFYDSPPSRYPKILKAVLSRAQKRKGYPSTPHTLRLPTYDAGKGAIVVMTQLHSYQNKYLHEWRYDRAVRAIYAAAQRPVADLDVGTEPALLDAAGDGWTCRAKLSRAKGMKPASLRIRIRPNIVDGRAEIAYRQAEPMVEKTLDFIGEAAIEMPPLPAGNYFAEATVLDAQGNALAWTLKPFVSEAAIRVWSAEVGTAVLQPDRENRVSVVIENASGVERDVALKCALSDTEGRVLARVDPVSARLKPGRNEVFVALRVTHSAAPMARLRLDILADGRTLDRRGIALNAEALMHAPDFHFAFYRDYEPGARKLGADTLVSTSGPGLGLRPFPWLDVMPVKDGRFGRPDDGVTNPETLRRASAYLTDRLRMVRPFKSVGVIIIDEWEHHFSPSPHHLAYFKKYLEKTYKTVAALNRSWGTKLGSFDEVSLDHCSEKAIRAGKVGYVPWADLQTAMKHAVADYVAGLRKAAATVDPNVRIGFSGTRETAARNGLDWWLLMQHFGSVSTYGGVHTRLEESFMKPGTRIFQWSYPTGNNIARAREDPWRDALRQRAGYLHYGGRWSDMFMPDYRPFPVAAAIAEEIEAIRGGPARLIHGAEREDFGIAILYSVASYHASYLPRITGGRSDPMNDILYSTDRVLADARLGSRFVSYEQLASGKVTPREYKVLMLPYAQALSEAEAKAAIAFAAGGGLVVADIRPGVYDEHCRELAAGQLDALFGIGPPAARPVMTKATLLPGKELPATGQPAVLMGEAAIALKGARAMASLKTEKGSAPAVLLNRFGKGKAVLLNFAYPKYRRHRPAGVGGEESIEKKGAETAAVRGFMAQLLAGHAGITPVARLLDAKGREFRAVRLFTYKDGSAHYIGLLPPRAKPDVMKKAQAKLVLARPRELYDARTGKHLGRRKELALDVQEAHAQLFTLLPYRVDAMELKPPRSVRVGEAVTIQAKLSTHGGDAGRHAGVALLRRPDGTTKLWDCRTFEMPKGSGTVAFPLAFNDPPGTWQIEVRDAATGVSATATVRVSAP